MAQSEKPPSERPREDKPDTAMEAPALDWNKCNVCGERFPNWPKLREHERQHGPAGVDAPPVGRPRRDLS